MADTYAALVRDLMQRRSDEIISNSDPSHARVLFEVFLENAKESLVIFSRKLDAPVFDDADLVAKAKAAVCDRGIRLDVIYQEAEPAKSKFVDFLRSEEVCSSGRVSFESCSKISALRSFEANYAVMDERAYRLEKDHKAINAVASMNAPDVSKSLSRIFDATKRLINSTSYSTGDSRPV
jgi:hypothetical protein